MEGLILLAGLAILAFPFAALIHSLVSTRRLREKVQRIESRLDGIVEMMDKMIRGATPPPEAARAPAHSPPVPAPPAREPQTAPPPAAAQRLSGEPPPRLQPPAAPFRGLSGPAPARSADDLEQRIGARWMIWVGAVILVLAVGFFLKYAFENAWIGSTGRVAMGLLAGLAMLVAGEGARRRGYPFLGQGLTGGGIAALYVSIYAASGFYHLIPAGAAFGFMLAVTAAGIALAVLQDALAIAVLATLGGLITPVLLSTGEDRAEVLFGYLAVLNLGVLGAAMYRRWRALDLLAYAGTLLLYGGWFTTFYRPERMGIALTGLLGFFALFLFIPVLPALRRRAVSPPEGVLLPAVAGLATFAFAYRILFATHKTGLAFLTLALSAAYLLLGALIRKRIPGDRPLVSGHLVLSAAFLTLAIPVQLGLYGITLAWAMEGPVLIALGFRFREPLVRFAGLAALALAVMRILTHHSPLHRELFRPVLNPSFGTVLFVALALGAAAWLWHRLAEGSEAPALASPLAVAAGLLAMLLCATEIRTYCALMGAAVSEQDPYRVLSRALTLVLLGCAALIFLQCGLKTGDSLSRVTGQAILFPTGAVAAAGIFFRWTFDLVRSRSLGALFLNRSFLSSLFVVACLAAAVRLYRWSPPAGEAWDRGMPRLLSGAALLLLGVILTLEVYRYFSSLAASPGMGQRPAWMAQMAVTVTWVLYALALLVAGFLRALPPLRYAAFALLGLSVLKVLTVDMSEARQIYRIVSLVAVGLVLVAVSYLYSRIARRRQGGGG